MDVRFAVYLSVVVALLVGCGGAAPSAAPTAVQSGPTPFAPAASVAAETSDVEPTSPVDPYAAPDEELVASLMQNEGLEESEAVFVALTKVEAEQVGPLTYRITEWYPTGNVGEITVTVTPDVTLDPEQMPPLTATYAEPDGDFQFRLEYFVPYDEMPNDVEQQIKEAAGGAALVPPAQLAAIGGVVVAEAKSGTQVIVEAVVKKLQADKVSEFAKALDQRLGPKAPLQKLYKLLKGALSIKDAWAMSQEHDAFMERLDALEDCVRNPTNPITKQTYESNPAEQQRVLDIIAGVRTEIKANVAVIYLGMLNSVASGFLSKAAPWLSYIVGPGTAWSKATLRQLNELLVEEVQRLVTPCEEQWDFTMTMGYGSGADRLSATWTGTFTVAPPVEGRPDRPITGAGTVTGEVHSSKCTIPIDLSGNSDIKTGDFRYGASAEFALEGQGTVEVTNRGPVLFLQPEPQGIEESFELEPPTDGCMEMAFVHGPLLAWVMTDPINAANEPVKIAANDNETLTDDVTVTYILGDDRQPFPMTRTVTIKKRQ